MKIEVPFGDFCCKFQVNLDTNKLYNFSKRNVQAIMKYKPFGASLRKAKIPSEMFRITTQPSPLFRKH